MKHLKTYGKIAVPALFIAALVALTIGAVLWSPAPAARPMAGSQAAYAGSGGVTTKTFVKLSAARTIVAATAVTDNVIGVCELTAAANANTKYAPVGTEAVVTSGEAIAVGDLLTTGAGGKAFVLDTDDTSSQRIAAVALSAASEADEDTTVLIVVGVAEQRLALGGNVTLATTSALRLRDANTAINSSGQNVLAITSPATTISGDVTLATTEHLQFRDANTYIYSNAQDSMTLYGTTVVNGGVTIAGSNTFATGTGAVSLSGDVTIAAGKDIEFAKGSGYLQLLGTTSGGIKIAPIATGTAVATIQNANVAASTIILPSASCTLPGLTLANVWTGTADFQGNITASTGDPSVVFSASSGAFATTTGAVTLAGNTTVSGSKTFATGTGAVTLAGDTTISGTKTFATGTGAVSLNGDVTIAAGKDIEFAKGSGYLQLLGTTSGGIKIAPIATGTAVATIQNANVAASVITLPSATCTLAGLALDNAWTGAADFQGEITVSTGDPNVVFSDSSGAFATTTGAVTLAGNVTVSGSKTFATGTGDVTVNGDVKVAATKRILDASVSGTKVRDGTPIRIVFSPTTGETLTWTVPAGYDLLVLNAYGWKTAAAAAGSDTWDLKNNDGTAANIFAQQTIGSDTLADGAFVQFDTIADTEWEVESGDTLDLVAAEDTDDDGADGMIVVEGLLKVAD